MAFEVLLHGGPWHGKRVAVRDGRDHIHIVMPVVDTNILGYHKNPANDFPLPTDRVKTREGTYSIVRHSHNAPHDFEWDGWVTHD